jgi:hypothetical protein
MVLLSGVHFFTRHELCIINYCWDHRLSTYKHYNQSAGVFFSCTHTHPYTPSKGHPDMFGGLISVSLASSVMLVAHAATLFAILRIMAWLTCHFLYSS